MRFLATSLSNLVDNLTEGINKSRCKNYNYFLEYESAKNSLIQYKCLSCNKDYSKKLNEELKEKFKNTYNFSNNGVNKFLLLRKDVYPYEYMDDWEKFNETILPKKKAYNKSNLEDITDADYMYARRDCKGFEIKSLGQYHDLYLRSDVLLLADAFESFRKMCLEVYELDPVKFLLAPGLAWKAALKKTGAKLDLIIDIDMLLMVEKGVRGGICNAVHCYAKVSNKYMNGYDENKESCHMLLYQELIH